MKVSIVGAGYVGLGIAMLAAKAGHEVSVIDINVELVKNLKSGKSHVEDVSSRELSALISLGKLNFHDDFKKVSKSRVVVVAVPTPLDAELNPDLRNLISACQEIAKSVSDKTLILNESTSYPGTLREVIYKIILNGNESKKIEFAVCPERIDPGNRDWTGRNIPRVIGALSGEAMDRAKNFYESMNISVVPVSQPEVAELAKLYENTFRQVNIALVNEFAQICSSFNVSALETLEAANTKPFGIMRFNPSLGVGGHCIPIDSVYLTWAAASKGIKTDLISIANSLNRNQVDVVILKILDLLQNKIVNSRIQVIGVTYKKNISDTRETPVRDLILKLRNLGAEVVWHDPLVKNWMNEESTEIRDDLDIGLIYAAHELLNLEAWRSVKFPVRFIGPGEIQGVKSFF